MIQPKRLCAVVLSVRDLDRSMAWYRAKFGFEKLYDDAPNSAGVVVGADGIEVCLNPLLDPDGATDVDTAHQACVQVFCLEIDGKDLDRVADVFSEDEDIVVLDDHPRYRSRIIADPDGHAIELIATRSQA